MSYIKILLKKIKLYMKLNVFGDSTVVGVLEEIDKSGIPAKEIVKLCRERCFATQIFKQSTIFSKVKNYGVPAYGNEQIAYKFSKVYPMLTHKDFVLICWSGVTRPSWYNKKTDMYEFVPYRGATDSKYCGDYHNNFYATRQPIFQLESLMLSTSYLLKKKNIPFLFTNSYEPFAAFTTLTKDILEDINYLEPYYDQTSITDIVQERFKSNIEPVSQKEIIQSKMENTLPIRLANNIKFNKYTAKCYHGTEEGNKLIAKTLIPYIKKNIKKNSVKNIDKQEIIY